MSDTFDFHIDISGTTPVVRYADGGCHPANRDELAMWREIKSLRQQLAELQAARFAYASEFEPNADGDPDVGSIHQNIRALKRQLAEARAGRVPEGFKLVPTPAKLKELLVAGVQIRLGEVYCAESPGRTAGEIITLVEGHFEYENGEYSEDQYCPAVWDEENSEFDSIYHLFGNDLDDFMDCEIVNLQLPQPPAGGVGLDETAASRDVLAERRRQVDNEGFPLEHDDAYELAELAQAAACYALSGTPADEAIYIHGRWTTPRDLFWPWQRSWWKPTSRRRDLVKAGALILAEIERLDRAAAQPQQEAGRG